MYSVGEEWSPWQTPQGVYPRAKTFKKATVSEKIFFVTGMPAEIKCYNLPARPMQSNKTIPGFTSVLEKS